MWSVPSTPPSAGGATSAPEPPSLGAPPPPPELPHAAAEPEEMATIATTTQRRRRRIEGVYTRGMRALSLVFLVTPLLAACGVPRAKYDAALKDATDAHDEARRCADDKKTLEDQLHVAEGKATSDA